MLINKLSTATFFIVANEIVQAQNQTPSPTAIASGNFGSGVITGIFIGLFIAGICFCCNRNSGVEGRHTEDGNQRLDSQLFRRAELDGPEIVIGRAVVSGQPTV